LESIPVAPSEKREELARTQVLVEELPLLGRSFWEVKDGEGIMSRERLQRYVDCHHFRKSTERDRTLTLKTAWGEWTRY
jgi:hypothetical protein